MLLKSQWTKSDFLNTQYFGKKKRRVSAGLRSSVHRVTEGLNIGEAMNVVSRLREYAGRYTHHVMQVARHPGLGRNCPLILINFVMMLKQYLSLMAFILVDYKYQYVPIRQME